MMTGGQQPLVGHVLGRDRDGIGQAHLAMVDCYTAGSRENMTAWQGGLVLILKWVAHVW